MLTLLMLADAISTLGLLRVGLASEGNPLMVGLVGIPWAFLVIKGALGFLADIVLPRMGWLVTYRLLWIIYAVLCLYHGMGWILG